MRERERERERRVRTQWLITPQTFLDLRVFKKSTAKGFSYIMPIYIEVLLDPASSVKIASNCVHGVYAGSLVNKPRIDLCMYVQCKKII